MEIRWRVVGDYRRAFFIHQDEATLSTFASLGTRDANFLLRVRIQILALQEIDNWISKTQKCRETSISSTYR